MFIYKSYSCIAHDRGAADACLKRSHKGAGMSMQWQEACLDFCSQALAI
jgi:hypothetical protein